MRIRASSVPKRNFERVFASWVLPTPVGPRKTNEPIGRFAEETPAILLRIALLITFIAFS